MSSSDAILVGEGWISEHYFTTDATSQSFQAKVIERRKAWDAEEKDDRPTPRTRFAAARQELVSGLARLGAGLSGDEATDGVRPDAHELVGPIHERIIEILELAGHGLRLERHGPLIRVSAPGITERAPLAVLLAEPVAAIEDLISRHGATLTEPTQLDEDGPEYSSVARFVSALFVEEASSDLVLVLAGRWALLAERERWAEGRYLALDVQSIAERNDAKRGGEIDRLLTCLSAESIAPNADGDLWWHGVLEDSIKHTVGVSQDLRDGVRLSIEIIANEVVGRRRVKNLDPLPGEQAQELAKQSLRFLYRILFLLYAEASPELGVLPAGVTEYDEGYSLDRLRELVQVKLATPQGRDGSHLYDSLGVLFRLVENGNDPKQLDDNDDGGASTPGLEFNPLRADLFRPLATAHIDAVGLGNRAVQRVLMHLLLSKEKRGRDRGFISYAELGINQLGAVYEGLMSYTGFFAETDLYEVAKNGDASKGSWVVPTDRAEGITPADFVRETADDGQQVPVLHPRGSFVFRLAGRERQQSASYYTPEVLTRFTVGQALEELLDQDGHTTTAAEILDLTVCEPALGSGAFAIEAVRQLAAQYLERRQKELDKRIDPDDYPRRVQEVKAYLALHNVYGVDLNSTAVELAEISLWLDTMVEGLSAPWFGLHLRRGNSLVGARRATYSRQQVSDKSWLTSAPREMPLSSLAADADAGQVGSGFERGIHHFLLPADGWGAAADAKEAAALEPDAARALKDWRRSIKAKPTKAQLDDLSELAHRVEVLWQFAYRRLQIAEQEIRRAIPVWESGDLPAGGAVQREQIEAALADADGAYRRVKRVMDAWCALWFWPLTDRTLTVRTESGPRRIAPPTLAEWIAGLQALLGRSPEARRGRPSLNNQSLSSAAAWDDLGVAEAAEMGLSAAESVDLVLRKHPWLVVCDRVAEQQGSFHWNLEYGPVFARRGGFDLQLGNPPWVRPDFSESAALAEHDVWWALTDKPPVQEAVVRRANALRNGSVAELYGESAATISATRDYLSAIANFPHSRGLRADLYRCFMSIAWQLRSLRGVVGLVHPEKHFTDENAGPLRRATYAHLRRHWAFENVLGLFEIGPTRSFGVHVYGAPKTEIGFLSAIGLYHPETVQRSLVHDGSGPEPGQKDSEGGWDLRPHRARVFRVDSEMLNAWHAILEDESSPVHETRMIFASNQSTATVLEKVAQATRLGDLDLEFFLGLDETAYRNAGVIVGAWGRATDWRDVILQGPNIHVAIPFNKYPNPTMLNKQDYSRVDLERLEPDEIPVTGYKPGVDRDAFNRANPHVRSNVEDAVRNYYRVLWRSMAVAGGERTLIPVIVPPGTSNLKQNSYGFASIQGGLRTLVLAAGFMSSLPADLAIRCTPKSSIPRSVVERLPISSASHPLSNSLVLRTLRLNCLSDAYSDLWKTVFVSEFDNDSWASGSDFQGQERLGVSNARWDYDTPLRRAADRRRALMEIDCLVALMLGMTANELCTTYRTQFSVLYGYDRNVYFYDANGRLVPNSVLAVWRKKSDRITEDERTATNQAGNTYTYELPFVTLDREADMRQAYAEFERRLAGRTAAEKSDQNTNNTAHQGDAGA